ncbi:hypothetical protein GCM10009660_55480 [Catellatospora bangladeshensis]
MAEAVGADGLVGAVREGGACGCHQGGGRSEQGEETLHTSCLSEWSAAVLSVPPDASTMIMKRFPRGIVGVPPNR